MEIQESKLNSYFVKTTIRNNLSHYRGCFKDTNIRQYAHLPQTYILFIVGIYIMNKYAYMEKFDDIWQMPSGYKNYTIFSL